MAENMDLVLTASVNWSSDTKNIIENDEKEFHLLNGDETGDQYQEECGDEKEFHNNNNNENKKNYQPDHLPNNLNVSWGNYFAKKSPPMGDLCGSYSVHQRPTFNQQKQASELTIYENQEEEQQTEQQQLTTTEETEKAEEQMDNDGDQEPAEEHQVDDMVVINTDDINKSLENINLDEFTKHYLSNRDSNSTQKSNQSTDSQKSNHIFVTKKMKYIQRFYQFTLKNVNDVSHNIEQKIENIMRKYIKSMDNNEKVELAAVTFKKDTKKCTVLILFETDGVSKCDDNVCEQWINNFLSFSEINQLMDKSSSPCFTQLSSN